MSTATCPRNTPRDDPPRPKPALPLENGDHLAAEEFERRFGAMPDLKKAELIDGVVYVASSVTNDHSRSHAAIATWLGTYRAFTPVVADGLNSTIRLHKKAQSYRRGGVREYSSGASRMRPSTGSSCGIGDMCRWPRGLTASSKAKPSPASGSTPRRCSAATWPGCSKSAARGWIPPSTPPSSNNSRGAPPRNRRGEADRPLAQPSSMSSASPTGGTGIPL